jgi:hypothetical protein
MAKKEPFTQIGVIKRIKAIENNQRDKLPENYSKNLRDLVDYLLIVDKFKRPTIE